MEFEMPKMNEFCPFQIGHIHFTPWLDSFIVSRSVKLASSPLGRWTET
jgi:hypothetical protein